MLFSSLLALSVHLGPRAAPPRLSRAAVTAAATLDVGAVVPTRAPAAVGADAWAASLDYPAFRAEVNALGKRLEDGQGEADVRHLKKMLAWSNACALVGVATMWMSGPLARLLPIVALSTWTCTRWTMIGHHICHGGYNRQDDRRVGGSGRFTSAGFAVGSAWRRARDWLDWMLPEAWNVEHNNLHHYRLSESGDPDLVERNLELMREFPAPRPIKYVAVAFLAAMWKWCAAPRNSAQLRAIPAQFGAIATLSDAASAPTPGTTTRRTRTSSSRSSSCGRRASRCPRNSRMSRSRSRSRSSASTSAASCARARSTSCAA